MGKRGIRVPVDLMVQEISTLAGTVKETQVLRIVSTIEFLPWGLLSLYVPLIP